MPNIQQNRLGYFIIVGAALMVFIWGIRNLAPILNPILLASVITITLLPVPNALTKRGMKSGPALLVTILLVVVALVAVAGLVLLSLSQLNTDLPRLTDQFQTQQTTVDDGITTPEQLADEVISTINARQFSALFAGIIAAVGSAVAQFFLTLLVFVFMLYTAMSIPNLSRLGINMESNAVSSLIDLTAGVRRYITVSTGINILTGLANTILLWLLGVPFAILWGILAAILGYIPAVGYWLALIPPLLIAYSQFGIRTALIVFVGYALINGTAANIISPRVLGQSLRMSPLVVVVSVFIWASLLGGIGAILATPLMLLIIVILENFDQTKWIANLMRYVPGSEEKPDEAAVEQARSIWQRVRDRLPGAAPSGPLPPAGPITSE
jgi:AI-2 transport protein TqsA